MDDTRERIRCRGCGRLVIVAAHWGELTAEIARESRWCDSCAYPDPKYRAMARDGRLQDAQERRLRPEPPSRDMMRDLLQKAVVEQEAVPVDFLLPYIEKEG